MYCNNFRGKHFQKYVARTTDRPKIYSVGQLRKIISRTTERAKIYSTKIQKKENNEEIIRLLLETRTKTETQTTTTINFIIINHEYNQICNLSQK